MQAGPIPDGLLLAAPGAGAILHVPTATESTSGESRTNMSYETVSDFMMTGCAIAPVFALYTERPELALLSHIVLLLAGILFAAGDREAPFRKQAGGEREAR